MSKKLICLTYFVFVLSLTVCVACEAAGHLVVHWAFDENSGSTVTDSAGGVAGDVVNATWTQGLFPGSTSALDFNGSDAYVNVTGQNWGTFEQVSVALWLKFDNLPGPYNSLFHEDWSAGGIHFMVRSSGVVGFSLNGRGPNDFNSQAVLEAGTIYHVVATFDITTGHTQIYIDGMLDSATNSSPSATEIFLRSPFTIGSWNTNRYWDGVLDDLRIYDRILSEKQIENLFNGIPPEFTKAENPSPADGAMVGGTWVTLKWMPGELAVSHDVYLSDNFDDVNDGTPNSPVFQGSKALTDTMLIAGFFGFPYPDGLVPGTTYYWRIDEVNNSNPNSPWKGDVWSFWVPPIKAYEPYPADGAPFVSADAILGWTAGMDAKLHYIHFDDNFDNVNNALVDAGEQTADTIFAPGALEKGKTYYWRIDESNPPNPPVKGDIWSFTTLPDIPVTDPNLVAWWRLDEASGTAAVDWSGHDHHGTLMGNPQHVNGYDGGALEFGGRDDFVHVPGPANLDFGTDFTWTAWIKTSSDGTVIARAPATGNWAQGGKSLFVRGGLLTVDVGWVGYVESTIAVDDGQWHHVAATTQFQTGVTEDTTTLYIDGEFAGSRNDWNVNQFSEGSQSVKIGFTNGNFPASPWFNGLIDEVRAYNKVLTATELKQAMRGDTTRAWDPSPADGSTSDVFRAASLSWSPGDKVSEHAVYFGTDRDAVGNADASDTTGVYRGRQTVTSYSPPEGVEWGGGPYYWRIDEHNTDATITKGQIWNFMVADYLAVDDFESYDDIDPAPGEPGLNRIFDKWIDGYDTPLTNGAIVGNPMPPYAERVIVHGGLQSMNYSYDNAGKTSEATLTLVYPRDWTEQGVTKLSLWLNGSADNASDRLYVALNGTAVVYHDDPAATQIVGWTEWVINLAAFGVNLTNVNTITIGIGTKNVPSPGGGTGIVYFDDIRLIR